MFTDTFSTKVENSDNFPTIAENATLSIEKVEKTAWRYAQGIEIDDMMHELIVIIMNLTEDLTMPRSCTSMDRMR